MNLPHFSRRRLLFGSAAALAIILITFFIAAYTLPLPQRLNYADSVVITYADGRPAHALLSDDDKWRFPTRLHDVDPAYIDALITLEDERFYSHPGVDPIAILRAALDNLRAGTTVSGASTITMQLVRLLEPRPRTLRSKIIEAFRATQLELHLSKEEILEAYLRFISFGGNLEGIEAATLSYWSRPPSSLTAAEIATLLAIPQSPTARRPSSRNAERLTRARDQIAHQLASKDAIPLSARQDELQRLLDDTPVPLTLGRPPREIPHVVQWLRQNRPDVFDRPETGRKSSTRIQTTLERSLQLRVSAIVADHEARLRATGAPHAAVVVLETRTGNIRALVGNLRFDITVPGSHLPAFASPRASGSLLKPFAYAAALDEGLLAPSHALLDVPLVRGDYRPQNFDRTYRGLVEAEEALALSLNLPFVRLVERLTVEEFVQTLARFDFLGPIQRAGHGGLELVVGGLPATPLEIAALYAGLARQGQPVTPQIYHLDTASSPSAPSPTDHPTAITNAAAWLTMRALSRRPTPSSPIGPRRARDTAFVWKTGTSYAYHDAWTAGFGQHYTAVVWAGNLAYKRHPELIGARVAAPIFFEILTAIDQPYPLREQRPHDALADIEVCNRSGRRATHLCRHTTTTTAPAHTAAPELCEIHVEIEVDAHTGYRLPRGCAPASVTHTERRVVEHLPDPVAHHRSATGRRAGSMPDIHPDCRAEQAATLAITSPREATRILLDPARPASQQLVRLQAYSSAGASIHWYINGRHLHSAPSSDPVYWPPQPGTWTITAVDDRGIRTARKLVVASPSADE